MNNVSDQAAYWLVKALVTAIWLLTILALAAAAWVFGLFVRGLTQAIVSRMDERGGNEADGWLNRLIGAAVGAVVALLLGAFAVVGVSLPIGVLGVMAFGGLVLGAIVVTDGFDPWRALPRGEMVDDWRDDWDGK